MKQKKNTRVCQTIIYTLKQKRKEYKKEKKPTETTTNIHYALKHGGGFREISH